MDLFDAGEMANLADLVEQSWTGTATLKSPTSTGHATAFMAVPCREKALSGTPIPPLSQQGLRPVQDTSYLLSQRTLGATRPTGDWHLVDEQTGQVWQIERCMSPEGWPYVQVAVRRFG